jgi:hypothetical protein
MLDIIARGTKSVTRMRPLWLYLAAWLTISSAASTATAADRAFALTWTAPPECPDAATVEGFVDADVGETAYGPAAVRARGTVQPTTDGRYAVVLDLDTGGAQSNERQLVDGSCEAVSQAAALLVALAIRARAAPPASPSAPAERPVRATALSHERPFAAAEVLTDLGSLPTATVGLGLAGGVTFAGLRLEPTVAYFAPQSGNVSGRADLGARFALGAAAVRLCAPFPRSDVWLAPCFGAGVDWIVARGFGARAPRNASTFDAVATAAALGGWDVSSIISLHLEVGAVVPFARPEFEVDGVGDGAASVYRRAPLAFRGAFGLELHF